MNKLHSVFLLFNIIIGAMMTFDWTQIGLAPHTAQVVAGVVLLGANMTKLALNATGNGATGVK